jgi:hypothetical protein
LDGVPNHDKRSRIKAKNTKLAPHTLSYMSCKSADTLDVTCRIIFCINIDFLSVMLRQFNTSN